MAILCSWSPRCCALCRPLPCCYEDEAAPRGILQQERCPDDHRRFFRGGSWPSFWLSSEGVQRALRTKRWAAPATNLGALALSAICLARVMYSFTRSNSRRTECCLGSSPTVQRYIQKSEFRLYRSVRSSRALSNGDNSSVTAS